MTISIRDAKLSQPLHCSVSGQAIVEYILVLSVTVLVVLGGIYQLNTAFKSWASNYFGTYLACLLETGDLPGLSGTSGTSGICNQLFKPFSLADGRPLIPGAGSGGKGSGGTSSSSANSSGGSSRGAGTRESNAHSSSGAPGTYISSHFGAGSGSQSGANQPGRRGGNGSGEEQTNTGSTAVSNYGRFRSSGRIGLKDNPRLDNHFAFEDEQETTKKRKLASSSKPTPAESTVINDGKRRKADALKNKVIEGDTVMSFGNFLRYIIIAAIIIALVVFLGGQMLQVNKSME